MRRAGITRAVHSRVRFAKRRYPKQRSRLRVVGNGETVGNFLSAQVAASSYDSVLSFSYPRDSARVNRRRPPPFLSRRWRTAVPLKLHDGNRFHRHREPIDLTRVHGRCTNTPPPTLPTSRLYRFTGLSRVIRAGLTKNRRREKIALHSYGPTRATA